MSISKQHVKENKIYKIWTELNNLKHANLYNHEYDRIKYDLDTTLIDPITAGTLEDRNQEIKTTVAQTTRKT